jgi:integrating conjugative element membrane protein (TIGR03747 family)
LVVVVCVGGGLIVGLFWGVVLTLPAYAMIGVMSLVDGLVQRDLRRFGGGLESGLLYHHLKAMLRPMLSLPIFLYLISPWSLHPTTIFVPFVLGFGYFVQRTVVDLMV